MTVLVDTGPIMALLDRRQPQHEQCRVALESSSATLVTCDAVVAEACYLLRKLPGAAADLLKDVEARRYWVKDQVAERAGQIRRLLMRHANVPMDFADACLVDMASIYQTGRILTLDADFAVYRWGKNRPFEMLVDLSA